jgi:hypothetical protein
MTNFCSMHKVLFICPHIHLNLFLPRFLEPYAERETWTEGEYWLWMNRAVLDNIAVELTASTCQYQTQGQVSYHRSSNLLGYSANYLVDYAYLPNGKQARYGYLVFFIHAYTDNINVGSGAFGNNGHDRKAREIIGHMQPIACPEILAMDCTIRALQKYSNRHHFAESAFNPCFHV